MSLRSQNGWPVLEPGSGKLYPWRLPLRTGERVITLRNGSAGFVLAHWVLFFHERIESINGPQLDDWGYAYRYVRGENAVWSNHSSGTAVDLNALVHPMGKRNTFPPRVEQAIRDRLTFYRVLSWGEDWRRPDGMHFELGADLDACEAWARKRMDTWRGARILEVNPGQRKVILS